MYYNVRVQHHFPAASLGNSGGGWPMTLRLQCTRHCQSITCTYCTIYAELVGVACRLLLVTTSLPRDLPSELVAMTTVVLFWPEVGGVRELLLDRLLWQQNTKIAQERQQLCSVGFSSSHHHITHTHTHTQEVHRQSLKVEQTERELLDLLCRDDSHHDNHQTARELLQINASYNNSDERWALFRPV